MNIELDPIDLKIIALLKQDSRLTNKDIGQRVHRTGQAVGARIAQLMDAGGYQKLHYCCAIFA